MRHEHGLKILYLVHRVPFPPDKGDRIRSFHLLEFLAARAEVHLACLADEPVADGILRALEGRCGRVAVARLGPRARWLRAARSLAAGRTATEGLFDSRELRRTIRRWARETRYDAVLAFSSSMVQYLDACDQSPRPVTVVDLVDVDSQKWFDYGAGANGLKRRLFHLEGRRLRRLERSLAKRVQAVTLVSTPEADMYREFAADAPVHAISNGVDLDYFRPDNPAAHRQPATCVFVGALDYRANVDGVCWFCQTVWPEVRRRYGDVVLELVGRRPVAAIRRLAGQPGVELAADVPDVRPYLAGAAVTVVPLRVARGIQNKVLEALAMGKAVVASPEALTGLDVEAGVHVLRAGTPDEWVMAIGQVLDSPALATRLGQAGRAHVEQHHRWEHRLTPFERLLFPGVERKGRPESTLESASVASSRGGDG